MVRATMDKTKVTIRIPGRPRSKPGLDAAADFRRGDAFIMAEVFSRQGIALERPRVKKEC